MKQQSLFGNLPQLDKKTKELNKKVVKKANKPKASKTRTVRGGANSKNALVKKVETVVQAVRQKLTDDGSFELIRDEQTFRQYMNKVRENKIASLDTETTGLDPIMDKLVGLCLFTPGEKPAYIPVGHTDFDENLIGEQVSAEVMKEEMQKCIDADTGFVLHNAKFDMRVLRNQLEMSNYIKCIWDTQIAGNMLNEIEPHGLKYLWNKYANQNNEDEAESFDKLFEKIPFNYIPIDVGYIYASKDAQMTHELYLFQKQYLDLSSEKCKQRGLEEVAHVFHEIEIPIIKYLCEMEDYGVSIDDTKAKELSEKYHELLEESEQRVQRLVDEIDLSKLDTEKMSKLSNPINVGSPQQVSIIVYDALEMKSPDKRKPRGTGEDILKGLKEKHPKYGDFFDAIIEYKGIKKMLSTYVDKIPALKKEKTNKVHGQFNQYGAKTGRFSSSDPNLQNIPSRNKEIRKMFTASEGYVLIGADYSQQEPRVLAHLCKMLFDDDKMVNAYLSGKDLYAWMASEIYSKPYEECKEFRPDGTENKEGKSRRDSVKSIILGLMYGRGVPSIAEQLGWSVQETQKIADMFFESFPAIKQVLDYYVNMAKTENFVSTVWGRKRRLPEINLPEYEFVDYKDRTKPVTDKAVISYYWQRLKNAWGREKFDIKQDANSKGIWIVDNGGKIADAERQSLNSVIQGSSADITKKAMITLGDSKELRDLGFRMLLTVHDEIIGEAPRENAIKCSEIMCKLMIDAPTDKISVPMKVDAELIERWYGDDIYDTLKSEADL